MNSLLNEGIATKVKTRREGEFGGSLKAHDMNVRSKIMFWIAPVLLLSALIVLYFEHASPSPLLKIENLLVRVLKEGTPYALLAMGGGLVLATGGVDISVAGMATLSGVIFAALTQYHVPWVISSFLATIIGCTSGLLLGHLVHKNAPPLLTSWAFGTIWFITSLWFAAAGVVRSNASSVLLGSSTSPDFWHITGTGIKLSGFFLIALISILSFSNLPRRACAIGANRDSAIYAGIRTGSVLRRCYAINGAFASLAGVFSALLTNGASTTDQIGRELISISIAVLGGTVMSGGYLCLPSIVAAAMFWVAASTIVNGLDLVLLKEHQQHAVNAIFALIFIAIVVPLGRHLSAETRTIHTEQKAQES